MTAEVRLTGTAGRGPYRITILNNKTRKVDAITGGEDALVEVTTPATRPVAAKVALADGSDCGESYTFGLKQNNPNPFNPATAISYSLPQESDVHLVIYHTLGQQVRVPVSARESAGQHALRWDGRDAFGRTVVSGTYLYRLVAGQNEATRKMIFSK